jgi:hypothetical protein
MTRDQPTELRQGGATPASQRSGTNARPRSSDRGSAPVPEDNQPGHHPDHEQDQPDPEAFVARFNAAGNGSGDGSGDGSADGAREATDEPPTRLSDHGANAAPGPFGIHVGLRLPRSVLATGARGAARVLHLGGRTIESVADRLDRRDD